MLLTISNHFFHTYLLQNQRLLTPQNSISAYITFVVVTPSSTARLETVKLTGKKPEASHAHILYLAILKAINRRTRLSNKKSKNKGVLTSIEYKDGLDWVGKFIQQQLKGWKSRLGIYRSAHLLQVYFLFNPVSDPRYLRWPCLQGSCKRSVHGEQSQALLKTIDCEFLLVFSEFENSWRDE